MELFVSNAGGVPLVSVQPFFGPRPAFVYQKLQLILGLKAMARLSVTVFA
jgi:hypothetical protein